MVGERVRVIVAARERRQLEVEARRRMEAEADSQDVLRVVVIADEAIAAIEPQIVSFQLDSAPELPR